MVVVGSSSFTVARCQILLRAATWRANVKITRSAGEMLMVFMRDSARRVS